MKLLHLTLSSLVLLAVSPRLFAQTNVTNSSDTAKSRHLYIDVHHLPPGKVTYQGVAEAHAKDLATERKYGVEFLKFWVDEEKGLVYCLSSAPDSNDIRKTHAEAHGMLPDNIYIVTDGQAAKLKGENGLFLDIHEFGPGKVSAAAVAGAHQKDLAVQKKYGVNFINYWVDEQRGTLMCLAQAPDSAAMVNAHKEAHGLIPVAVMKVKQGQ
jgi:hypothetical protein